MLDLVQPLFLAWPEASLAISHAYVIPGQPLSGVDPRLAQVLKEGRWPVLLGNPMTGRRMELPTPSEPGAAGEPVVHAEQGLMTVMRPPPLDSPRPCIACGWCYDVCPTVLRPVHLMDLALTRQDDHRLAEQLDWCIECGLCSHVCPASLPLTSTLRQAKQPSAIQGIAEPDPWPDLSLDE